MLHYFDVHLESRQIDTFVIPIGVIDILRDSSPSKIDEPLQNINYMSLKCKKFAVKNIYIPGLVYKTRVNIAILERIHDVIPKFC